MAGTHAVTTGAKIYLAQVDISADAHAHSIAHSVDLPEDMRYGDTWKRRLIGQRDMNFSLAGNVDISGTSDQDTIVNSKMGVNNVPLIIAPSGASIGDPCEFGLIVNGQYTPQAVLNNVFKYGLTGQIASRKWVMGKVLWNPATSITGTANGAEVLLSAVSATQKLYVAIVVIAATLTSMTVKVQSDTTGFPSSADQKTFTSVTGVTSEMPTPVDGAITDTYFRAAVTAFSGTSAQMIVVAGIA
jgi:hypothetical protein